MRTGDTQTPEIHLGRDHVMLKQREYPVIFREMIYMRRVHVEPYNPLWAVRFQDEAAQIQKALCPWVLAIHHMGSTAVPGLAAKPIIDLLVVVSDMTELTDKLPALKALGYEFWGEYGIPNRYFFPKGGDQRTHHLHMVSSESPHIVRHLAFRDYLISHPDEAFAYAKLKMALAARFPTDIDGYINGKSATVSAIQQKALDWYRMKLEE